MAFIKFLILIAVIAASVNAKFVWQDDGDDWPKFQHHRMPVAPTPPFRPFAPFAPFPPFGRGFGHFPNFFMPQIRLPVIPTPGQIMNVVPAPGQVYHGAVVKSSSSYSTDKDGKPIKLGGTSIITNTDGVVNEIKEGNAPPDLNAPFPFPTKMKSDFPKFPDFPEFKPFEFPDFPDFEPIEMPTMKPMKPVMDKIKSHVPKQGESFSAVATSSFRSSKTVNGKTVYDDGGESIVANNNGKTDEQHVEFHKGDKDAEKQ